MCIKCGKPLTGQQTKYCSISCKNVVMVTKSRQNMKRRAVKYKGSSCIDCGYSKCVAAMHFHHPDGNKEFGIAASGVTRSWEKVKEELDKCVLVCANCHAERHHHTSVAK